MALSLKKLESIVAEKNYRILEYLTDATHRCLYLKLARDALLFYLYIPSKYEFHVPLDYSSRVYLLEELDEEGRKVEAEGGSGSGSPSGSSADGGEAVSDLYAGQVAPGHQSLDVKSLSLADPKIRKRLLKITHLISRVQSCVKNIPFKFGIVNRDFLCMITRHNELANYRIRDYSAASTSLLKGVRVIVDLEMLYERKNLFEDLVRVKSELYQTFEKNYRVHLQKVRELREIGTWDFSPLLRKLTNFNLDLDRVHALIERTTVSENQLREKIEGLSQGSRLSRNVFSDFLGSANRNGLEELLRTLLGVKTEAYQLLTELETDRDNWVVTVNSAFFANEVFVHRALENLRNLYRYVGSERG